MRPSASTKGFAATVYNRTKARPKSLLAKGAKWADSPKAVAEQSDVVFTIVGFPDGRARSDARPHGALAGSKPGNDPRRHDDQRAVAGGRDRAAAKAKGVHSVDAPVSGGDVGAREARLSIMIGGDKDVVDALRPCWEAMGKTIVHQGPAGAGQHTKMVNQILIATNMIGVCEALLYGYKAGLNLETVMQSVGSGRGRQLVAVELRPANHGQQLRSRLLRRALHQGHGHRPGRIEAHGPLDAGAGAGASACTSP